jgi:U1 zinc finger
MHNHKNLLVTVFFSLCVSCCMIQAMKRLPEIDRLLQAVEEEIQFEDADTWHEDVTTVIKKKAKFEVALAQVKVPEITEPTISHKKIPPVRIILPKIVTPIPLRVTYDYYHERNDCELLAKHENHITGHLEMRNEKKYHCDVCDVWFTTDKSRRRHYKTQKHQVKSQNPLF